MIDAHVHLYPPEVNRDPGGWAEVHREVHWKTLCARARKNGQPVQGFPDVSTLLRAMDEAGVDRAILQGWYWENHETCAQQNAFFLECIATHPDRLSACAALHPRAGASAMREAVHHARENGFCGLGELSPHSQLFSVDDPAWRAVLDAAAEEKLPVVLHVTEPSGRGYPGRVLTPLEDFVRLAREHPQTTFVLAHWAALLPFDPQLGAETTAAPNIFFDTAASPLLYDHSVFEKFRDAVGADRILFGSDFPLILFPREETSPSIARFARDARARALSATDQKKIFSENARRIFRL